MELYMLNEKIKIYLLFLRASLESIMTPTSINKGSESIKGDDKLVASGPVSFGRIYSTLNEILRRGGTYRNGACVLHLDLDHPDIIEFITTPRSELPWVKRCVNINEVKWECASQETKDALIYLSLIHISEPTRPF